MNAAGLFEKVKAMHSANAFFSPFNATDCNVNDRSDFPREKTVS